MPTSGIWLRSDANVDRISQAPRPSLLATIARKLSLVAVSRNFLAFEDDFVADGEKTRCWVTMLPLSSAGAWVDYVYVYVSVGPAAEAKQVAQPVQDEAEVAEMAEPVHEEPEAVVEEPEALVEAVPEAAEIEPVQEEARAEEPVEIEPEAPEAVIEEDIADVPAEDVLELDPPGVSGVLCGDSPVGFAV